MKFFLIVTLLLLSVAFSFAGQGDDTNGANADCEKLGIDSIEEDDFDMEKFILATEFANNELAGLTQTNHQFKEDIIKFRAINNRLRQQLGEAVDLNTDEEDIDLTGPDLNEAMAVNQLLGPMLLGLEQDYATLRRRVLEQRSALAHQQGHESSIVTNIENFCSNRDSSTF